jgi:hypothetical protein
MTARSFWLLPALLVAAACSDDATSPANGNTDGRLQVVPGVAALAAVDVVVDGQTKLTNAAYGVPSAAIALSLGQHQVKVVPAGTAPSLGGTTVTLRAGDTTRVVVIGTPDAMNPVALGDTGAAPIAGKGKLRVSNMAANAPAIDVYRTQPDFPTFTKFQDVALAYQASTPFIAAPPGNWVVRVNKQGSDDVLAQSGPIRVDELWIRTVLILDAPNGGVKITVLGDQ